MSSKSSGPITQKRDPTDRRSRNRRKLPKRYRPVLCFFHFLSLSLTSSCAFLELFKARDRTFPMGYKQVDVKESVLGQGFGILTDPSLFL